MIPLRTPVGSNGCGHPRQCGPEGVRLKYTPLAWEQLTELTVAHYIIAFLPFHLPAFFIHTE